MRKRLSLDGVWDLHWQSPQDRPLSPDHETPKGPWKARVPGEIHCDLLRVGAIPDPLYGKNADELRWMDEVDWWYERAFEASPEMLVSKCELLFEGLDTTATIWLNGECVGNHNNMFIPYRIDVSRFLKAGTNQLAVRLNCGLHAASSKPVEPYNRMPTVGDPNLPRMWIRKAQYSFGWDWAPPRLLTCGIWRPVLLEIYDRVALREPYLRTKLLEDGSAIIHCSAVLENLTPNPMNVSFQASLLGEDRHGVQETLIISPGSNPFQVAIHITDPNLWWPHNLGEPYLYIGSLQVLSEENEILDQFELPFGLREVILDQSVQSDGKPGFTFLINGVPTYAYGANWAPGDSLLPRMVPEKYHQLIQMAFDQGINCLRIWGGGIYEDPFFYALCDQYGIMVWQDFMFACCYYPDDDDDFCAEIRHEAETILKQLRNHASIIVWCGNNENQWLHQARQREGRAADRLYGEKLYDVILPQICRELDPSRPYWPSSPYGGEEPNSPDVGDRHLWNVGDPPLPADKRVVFSDYAHDTGRFVSEFGILSATSVETLKSFIPPEEMSPHSDTWRYHQNWFDGGAVEAALGLYWKDPQELPLEEYVLASQILQAEALGFALRQLRRRKFQCSGALYWMLADCWGTSTSWSTIDYQLRKKPSFYSVKRAFTPLLICLVEEGNELVAWLVNDTKADSFGEVELISLDLQTSMAKVEQVKAVIESNRARSIIHYPLAMVNQEDKGRYVIHARYRQGNQVISDDRYSSVGFRFSDLLFPEARIEYQLIKREDESHVLTIKTDQYVWIVCIDADPLVWLEDNYFSLLPGEEREIRLKGKDGHVSMIRIRTLGRNGIRRISR